MSTNMLLYVIYGVGGIFAFIVIAYIILNKKNYELNKKLFTNKKPSDIIIL